MSKNNFVNKQIIEKINSYQEYDIKGFQKICYVAGINNTGAEMLYTLSDRKFLILEILQTLNSGREKLIFIRGLQGVGKTTLLRAINKFVDNNVLHFYYTCSTITNLDDIILAFYNFLDKNLEIKETKRTDISNITTTVDEKILGYLKTLNRPLLMTIDDFDRLIKSNTEIKEDIAVFLRYLASVPNLKLIIAGQRMPTSNLGIKDEFINDIRLCGLDKDQSLKFLKKISRDIPEHILPKVYEITHGYPETLLWFVNAVNVMRIEPFELAKNYFQQEDAFENFVVRIFYNSLSENAKSIVHFLTLIRHPLKTITIKHIFTLNNIHEELDYLKSTKLIAYANDSFYIKDYIKNIIKNLISKEKEIELRKFIYKLYTQEISKKLKERIMPISRKLLHSEQFYHYSYLSSNGIIKTSQSSALKKELSPDVLMYTALQEQVGTESDNIINVEVQSNQDNDHTEDYQSANEIIKQIDQDIIAQLSEDELKLLEAESTPVRDEHSSGCNNANTVKIIEKESPFEEKADNFMEPSNLNEAQTQYDNALQLLENTNNKQDSAQIYKSLSQILYSRRKNEEAASHLQKAINICSETGNINFMLECQTLLAEIYMASYKHNEALLIYNQMLNSQYHMPDKLLINTLLGIANIYNYKKDYENALKYYLKVEKYQNAEMEDKIKALLYFNLALIYDDINQAPKALKYYKLNTEITNYQNNPHLSDSYFNIASIFDEKDELEKAIHFYKKSLLVDQNNNNYEGLFKTYSILGNIYYEKENYPAAIKCFDEEIKIAKASNDPYWISRAYLDAGEYYLNIKQYAKALKVFIRAQKVLGKTISTDSKERIERKLRLLFNELGEKRFNELLKEIKKKNETR